VTFTETLWGCPQCGQRMEIHDYEERRWRLVNDNYSFPVTTIRICQ